MTILADSSHTEGPYHPAQSSVHILGAMFELGVNS